jgi:transposase
LRTSQRETFGKRSEKLSPDQFNLPLEDAELAQGVLEAAQEKAEAALRRARGETPRKPARNRGHLPAHLPRVERMIEPASIQCPCGCGEMARIGEDISERLDVIPAQFQVLVTRRPRYACRRCSQAVAQAHAPEHVVPGGLPTERLIAVRHRSRTHGDSMAHHRLEVRRFPSLLPPEWDLRTAGAPSRSRHARQLGRARVLPPAARDRTHEGPSALRRADLRGQDPGAGA